MTPDEILQGYLEDLETGAVPFDEYLARYLDSAYLAAPLKAAEAVRNLPRPALPPATRQAHEARLRAAVYAQALPPPASARRRVLAGRPVLRWATALALLFALVLGSTTVVAAASDSVPGETLYPIKRASEALRLALTPPSAQTALHLALAQERADELTTVVGRGTASPQVIQFLTAAMLAESDLALDRVDDAPAAQQAQLLVQVKASTASHQALLLTVNKAMAAVAQADLASALATAQANSLLAEAQLTRLPDATGVPPTVPSPTLPATNTALPTDTPTATQTARPSSTPSPTATATPTRTPGVTLVVVALPTRTPTTLPTLTVPPPPTATPLPTETHTATPLPSATLTATATPTPTWTPTPTETPTPTATASLTPQPSPTPCPTNRGGHPKCRP
jgi:hypothetical protein